MKPFDVTKYLDTEEAIEEFLNACLAEGGVATFLSGLGKVAKARGLNELAKKANLSRTSLYKTLTPGAKPRFETIVHLMSALGLQFHSTHIN